MKFGEKLSSQMVPEWEDAYMNYDFMKTMLQLINMFKTQHRPASPPDVESQAQRDDDDVVIMAHNVRAEGEEERAETIFLKAAEEGGELEVLYFQRLDGEVNKVVKFYKVHVEEAMTEAAELNRQIQAMVSARGGRRMNLNKLKKAEDELRKMFIEFYYKLNILKSYSSLNITAFSKIMKKYDKIASRSASKHYMTMVHNSYLGTSDEINKLMERVETTFIEHFSNASRKKGMNILRPKKREETHGVTFSAGFFFGCMCALIIALLVCARNILNEDTIVKLYSLFGLVVLHMLMYAGNVYMWRRYRVNYSFIFGFEQGTKLGCREILLLTFSLSVLVLMGLLLNVDVKMYPNHGVKKFIPLGLVGLVIMIMLCPLNLFYRSSRYFLLVRLFHSALSPFYKVTQSDTFLVTQLTSQVQSLVILQSYICYYGWGDSEERETTCNSSKVFKIFSYIIVGIPFWLRFLQCLRSWYDEKDAMHCYNGLKFLSSLVAVCARAIRVSRRGLLTWKIIAIVSSIIATIYNTYWDIVIDWGLFQRHSTNKWLRDKLVISRTAYFAAIVINVLLRLVWGQTMFLGGLIVTLPIQAITVIFASLEIIRRGIWNFFRVENIHVKNVEKHRAFKPMPLPFDLEEDDEDRDE